MPSLKALDEIYWMLCGQSAEMLLMAFVVVQQSVGIAAEELSEVYKITPATV